MPSVLGRPTFAFLDAGASETCSYCMFLCESEGLEGGVASAEFSVETGRMTLYGNSGTYSGEYVYVLLQKPQFAPPFVPKLCIHFPRSR